MSALYRNRLNLAAEETPLPPLAVDIYQNGKLVHTAELPDPRQAYCEEYNRRYGHFGKATLKLRRNGKAKA